MKHLNKHWLREKKYISLKKEESILWDLNRECFYLKFKREDEIERIFLYKFYNMEYGKYNTAPKWYRRFKNHSQKAKAKQKLFLELKGYEDICYEDNYKDASWYW